VQRRVQSNYNIAVIPRITGDHFFITDHGHYILDCHFRQITNPSLLASALNCIPGVVENGLFVQMANRAIIASANGSVQTLLPA